MGILTESELQKMSFLTDQGYILVIAKTYIISVIIIFCLFVTISRYLKKKTHLTMWPWVNYLHYLILHLTQIF